MTLTLNLNQHLRLPHKLLLIVVMGVRLINWMLATFYINAANATLVLSIFEKVPK